MKKFSLSVAEPCHQNWQDMTPGQKGRFCASCQKTVVDFTAMNDREIAEFFKAKKGNTCGRFYNDQLNREIVVPQKHIPWGRYLFQATWPAFVLFLKSCGLKEDVVGKAVVEERKTEERLTMGMILPEITPVDTVKKPEVQLKEWSCTKTVGDVSIATVMNRDSTAMEKNASLDQCITEAKGDSTVVLNDSATAIQSEPGTSQYVTVGFTIVHKEASPKTPLLPVFVQTTKKRTTKPLLYPNPVHGGQTLTVVMPQKMSGAYQVVSLSGQVIATEKMTTTEKESLTIAVPSWPAGTYFLRLIDEASAKTFTEKFIVQ